MITRTRLAGIAALIAVAIVVAVLAVANRPSTGSGDGPLDADFVKHNCLQDAAERGYTVVQSQLSHPSPDVWMCAVIVPRAQSQAVPAVTYVFRVTGRDSYTVATQ